MKRTSLLLLCVTAVFAASLSAAAQKFQPKTIQFKGAPDYSGQELMDAAGLKQGAVLAYADMKDHSQKLMDTGVFEGLAFKFDGEDLIYTLTPSTALYPIRLENLPLTPGKELDAALHGRIPLYHGKVPAAGGLTEQVRQGLEEMLAAKGIKASVVAMPYTDPNLQKVTAISFTITAPPVEVGEIRLDGVADPLDSKAKEILAKLTGSVYDAEGSPNQIEVNLGNYFRDQGYLEAAVHATAQDAPVIAPDAVHIPFRITVSPGPLYRLAEVRLAPGLLVTQTEFDQQSHIHAGDVATSKYVRENWEFLARQYHNKGYMQARIHPAPSYDRAQGTVSFTVTAQPGPVFTMGKLTLENAADDLRAAMWSAWTMPTGAVFNEGAIRSYYASQNPNSALGRTFASANCIYKLTLNDDTHTVDVSLRLERKH